MKMTAFEENNYKNYDIFDVLSDMACVISTSKYAEMLCDKLNVFATGRIGRRVKDIYDLYILSYLSFS